MEPSQSEWWFPVVIVPNSDGTPVFCVDFRRLHEGTVKGNNPLPRMDDCIYLLGDATVFRKPECNAGYWEIPAAMVDLCKTTFTCYEGIFEYVGVPFGCTNAPATFLRALDMLLAGSSGRPPWYTWMTTLCSPTRPTSTYGTNGWSSTCWPSRISPSRPESATCYRRRRSNWATMWAREARGSTRRTSSAFGRRDPQGPKKT